MALSRKALIERTMSRVGQFTDMRMRWRAQRPNGEANPDGEVLLDVGGKFDAFRKEWSDEPSDVALDVWFHRGQFEAARWVAKWFESKKNGKKLRGENGKAFYSLLVDGGRRGGKTDLAVKSGVTYAVMAKRKWVWLISETEKKTRELADVVRSMLPHSWYNELGSPHFTFTLKNGSVIWLRSAHAPETLRTGRCDFAVLNEAQLIDSQAFEIVRPATADNGGLIIMAANPPEKPIGFWLETWREGLVAGKVEGNNFFLDARNNPHVDHESLLAMKEEVDDRTFQRDILGIWLPRADVVFHSWSDGIAGNVRPLPRAARDVTREFLKKHLKREFDAVLGVDLQKNPYPCAVGLQFFADPDDPEGEPLVWFNDEIVCEYGDEEALAMALIDAGYDPARTALIVDASGSWQAIDRKKNRHRPSFELFRNFGWRHVYKPDEKFEKNPPIPERVKVANTLFKNAHGKRRVFSDPELVLLNKAIKLWENRGGEPYRKSIYAHLCDAATYPLFRFFPRAAKKRSGAPKAETFPAMRPGADFGYR